MTVLLDSLIVESASLADFDTAFLEVSTYRFRHVVTGFFLFVIAKVKK